MSVAGAIVDPAEFFGEAAIQDPYPSQGPDYCPTPPGIQNPDYCRVCTGLEYDFVVRIELPDDFTACKKCDDTPPPGQVRTGERTSGDRGHAHRQDRHSDRLSQRWAQRALASQPVH